MNIIMRLPVLFVACILLVANVRADDCGFLHASVGDDFLSPGKVKVYDGYLTTFAIQQCAKEWRIKLESTSAVDTVTGPPIAIGLSLLRDWPIHESDKHRTVATTIVQYNDTSIPTEYEVALAGEGTLVRPMVGFRHTWLGPRSEPYVQAVGGYNVAFEESGNNTPFAAVGFGASLPFEKLHIDADAELGHDNTSGVGKYGRIEYGLRVLLSGKNKKKNKLWLLLPAKTHTFTSLGHTDQVRFGGLHYKLP